MNYGKVEERSSSRSRSRSTARRAATSAILTDILSRSDRAQTRHTGNARPGGPFFWRPRGSRVHLDGLQNSRSVLKAKGMHSDTHGQSAVLHGIEYLFGFELLSRNRRCRSLKLYRSDMTLMPPATAGLVTLGLLSPLKPTLGDSPRPTRVFFQDYRRKLAAG